MSSKSLDSVSKNSKMTKSLLDLFATKPVLQVDYSMRRVFDVDVLKMYCSCTQERQKQSKNSRTTTSDVSASKKAKSKRPDGGSNPGPTG